MKYMRYISWFLFLHLIWWGFTGMPLWGDDPSESRVVLLWVIHTFIWGFLAIKDWVSHDGN